MKETEFKERFVDRIVKMSSMDYVKDADALCKMADAGWESYLEEDSSLTPEDCAGAEMGCWE